MNYPADDVLRLEFLRGWFGVLAHGKAPPEIVEVAERAESAARGAILRGRAPSRPSRSGAKSRIADGELAEVPWTTSGIREALELRVELAHPRDRRADRKRRFGDEAIPMIDRLAIMSPTLNLYGLRTRAGFAAERPEVVVESLSNYARLAAGMVRAGVNTAGIAAQGCQALREHPRCEWPSCRAPTPRVSPKCAPRSRPSTSN